MTLEEPTNEETENEERKCEGIKMQMGGNKERNDRFMLACKQKL